MTVVRTMSLAFLGALLTLGGCGGSGSGGGGGGNGGPGGTSGSGPIQLCKDLEQACQVPKNYAEGCQRSYEGAKTAGCGSKYKDFQRCKLNKICKGGQTGGSACKPASQAYARCMSS